MIRVTAVFLICIGNALGQIGTATFSGRVTDPSGAVIAGVAVSVVKTDTNFQFTATTNADGLFRVQSLQPGPYRVTFEAAGFKRTVRDGLELRASETQPVDAALEIGNVTDSVKVTAQSQLLETETSAGGALVEGNVLYKLPIYQRAVSFSLTITPGLTLGNYGSAANGSLTPFNVAGARSSALGVFEDGVLGVDPNASAFAIKPIENSVAEVKILTSTLPAEYGHTAGGVMSVVKKSGTNEFHGLASEYGRTRTMQHRLFFDKYRNSQPQPGAPAGVPTFFMMPDASASGPVYIPKIYDGRNKTFFFFGWQKQVEKKTAIVIGETPNTDEKTGNFSFGGLGNPIYDPNSTRQLATGAWTRDPFPGNIIPMSRLDPVSARILQINPWQSATLPGTLNGNGPVSNYVYRENSRAFMEDYNVRIDQQISPALKFFGGYTYNEENNHGRPTNIALAAFDGTNGFESPVIGQNYSFGGTYVISPTMVEDARVGYYRRHVFRTIPSEGQNWGSTLGIPNISPAQMPAFGSGAQFTPDSIYGLTVNGPSNTVDEGLSFRSDLSKIHGTHAFKMGYEWLRNRSNSSLDDVPSGQFLFDTMTAGLQPSGQPVPGTGNTFAGFLVGAVRQATFNRQLTTWLPRSTIQSVYFQDDWKVSPTLTLNLGVRYANESPFTTKYRSMSNFDPNAIDSVTGLRGGIVHPAGALGKRDNNNFQPRIGMAWHPMQKWVFRGGFAVNTIDVKFPLSRDQFDEFTALNFQARAPGDPRPLFQLSQGPNPVVYNIRNNSGSPYVGANFSGRTASWWDPNLRNPYVMNWQSGLQYSIGNNYLLDVYYQGSAGVGLIERWQANTFPLSIGANDPALRAAVFAAPQNYRPFSQFGDVLIRSNFGHSTFHSGTVKLDKRYSTGLTFSTFYTFSKAIDSQDTDNSGTGVAPVQNRGLEKARAGYDRTHRFNAVTTYELPIGKGRRFMNRGGLWNAMFGGYDLAWIQMVESGLPLSFSFANSPNNYYPAFAGVRRPNVTGSPALRSDWGDFGGDRFNQANINAVIPMSYFSYPAAFTPGSSGRNIVTGTRLLYSQGSIQKNFKIRERMNLQLRLDKQNVFHNYNWNPPTTTVDFKNPQTFGKISADQRTSSVGGQPLLNLKIEITW